MNLNLFVFVFHIWIFISWVKCQDFCQLFKMNGYKALVFSPDSHNLFIIISDRFWIVNEVNDKLSFIGGNEQPRNSSTLLGNRMSTLFHTDVYGNSSAGDIIGFFDTNMINKDNAFGWMLFDQKMDNFRDICNKGVLQNTQEICGQYRLYNSAIDVEGIKKSITTFADLNGRVTNIMLVQTPDQSGQFFSRKIMFIFAQLYNNQKDVLFYDVSDSYNDTKSEFNDIKQLDPSLQVIGLFAKIDSNKKYNVYVLIKEKESITYCLIDDCLNKRFADLINCGSPVTTSADLPPEETTTQPITPSLMTTTPHPSDTTTRPSDASLSSAYIGIVAVIIIIILVLAIVMAIVFFTMRSRKTTSTRKYLLVKKDDPNYKLSLTERIAAHRRSEKPNITVRTDS